MSDSESQNAQDVSPVVVGTSVAGLNAASLLADRGVAVTLVRTETEASGQSTLDVLPPEGGEVVMGCCGHLVALHRRVGLEQGLRWHPRVHLMGPDGVVGSLAGDDLPAPLHLVRSTLALAVCKPRQRLRLVRGLLGLLQVSPVARQGLGRLAFDQWLFDHGQTRAVFDTFWAPLTRLAAGCRPDQVSASQAIRVFQEGLLQHEATYQLGVSGVSHNQLVEQVQRQVERAGGRLVTDEAITSAEVRDHRVVRLHLTDGQEMPVNQCVLAIAPDAIEQGIGNTLAEHDARFTELSQFEPLPRVDVHLRYTTHNGRRLMPVPHLVTGNGPVTLLLRRGVESGVDQQIEHLQACIYPAAGWIDEDDDAVADLAERAVRAALPEAEQVPIAQRQVYRRPEAALMSPAAVGWGRVSVSGSITNLHLAGSWCETGWPAGPESAARAGAQAAQQVLHGLGREHIVELSEIEPTPNLLYRLFSA